MTLFLFIIGASLSSFITLCAQRIASNQLPWRPSRSYCDNCHRPLRWWQLIPIFGFCLQRGHCYFCYQKFSAYFPLIELFAGLAFATLLTTAPIHDLVLTCTLLTLVFITTTDFFTQYVYPIAYCGLLPLYFITPRLSTNFIWAGGILIILHLASKQATILGSGDIDFIVLLSVIFGGIITLTIIQISSIIMLICFAITKQHRLPFIPALSFSTLIILFYQQY